MVTMKNKTVKKNPVFPGIEPETFDTLGRSFKAMAWVFNTNRVCHVWYNI